MELNQQQNQVILPTGFKRYVAPSRGGPINFDLPERYTPEYVEGSDKTSQIRVLGSGSFGVVIKCRDTLTNEDVAIKKMLNPFQSELLARRAYREFALMRRLPQHRNVIRLRDAFTTATSRDKFDSYYVVMEFMDYDMSQFWNGIAAKQVPHTDLSYLLYQMLCAVNHLHRLGIIHRDLKPANLAIKQSGFQVRLLDFGLARCFATVKMSNYVYTRWYRAPEVVLEAEYSSKADIWAIGCIFAEIVLGEVHLQGKTHIDQWLKIAEKYGMPSESFLEKVQPHVVSVVRKLTPPNLQPIPFETQFPDSIFPPDDLENPPVFCAAQARDLLSHLLVVNPDERFSAEQAIAHPYVNAWYDPADVTATLSPFDYDPEPQESNINDHWKTILWQEIQDYMVAHQQNENNNNNGMKQ